MVRCLSVMLVASFAAAVPARAEVTGSLNGSVTGLPIPRYVSLKADKVNMHIGPGKQYETKWVYQRAGLPVEITAEFENWRRVRDADGTEGWVYHSLLSGRRTGVVTAKSNDDLIAVHEEADTKSDIAAYLQPGVLAAVKRCDTAWCRVIGRGFEGWIPQQRLWGVYPNEQVD